MEETLSDLIARKAEEEPTYEEAVVAQIQAAESNGPGKLEDLLRGGDTWQVG